MVKEQAGQEMTVEHPGTSIRHTASWQCLHKHSGRDRNDYNAADNYLREVASGCGGSGWRGEAGQGGGGGGSACSGDMARDGGGSRVSAAFKQALCSKVGKKGKKEEARQGGFELRLGTVRGRQDEAERQGVDRSSSTQALYEAGKQEAAERQGGYDRVLRRRIQGAEVLLQAGTDDEAKARSSSAQVLFEAGGQEEARQGGYDRGLRRRTQGEGFIQAGTDVEVKAGSSSTQALGEAGRQEEVRQGGYVRVLRRRTQGEGFLQAGPLGRGDEGPLGPKREGRSSAEAGPMAPRPCGPTALCAVNRR
jgi:ribosomal protein L17